jgi:DNA-binding CsgD family transcriptional regulator
MMTLRPLRHNELLTGGVLVTITDAGARQFPDAEMIAEYFSLTRAEASVCEYLIKGLSLKEIAAQKHKSEATVRSYLKQVFIKTGQSRQGQLVSTILSSLLR